MTSYSMLQFALARGIGEAAIKKATIFIDHNKLSWDVFVSDRGLLRQCGLNDDKIENVCTAKQQAEILYDKLVSNGIEFLAENEKKYPQYLKKMLGEKCPAILFVSGNMDLLNHPSVGFCGSRKASEKGIGIAADCAKQLTVEHITIVSGYAAGTDLAAHKAALEHDGSTIFVLAEGILRASRKKEIRHLLTQSNHIYVSQFMPNVAWNVGNAMRRNSVIIGLSRAMILVESGKTGGTFAAGEEALRVGCPLFVIDFAQPEVTAEANPYFLANGGQPIRGKNGIPNISRVLNAVNRDLRSNLQVSQTCDNLQLKLI